jgi:hypothetical protein
VGGDVALDQAIDLISKAVAQQRCILFLGAGAHAPPPDGSAYGYPEAQRPPIGSALSRMLAERVGLIGRMPGEDPANLQRVALFYEIDTSRRQLVEAVTEAVHTGKQPAPLLRGLAELGFPLVITTNYDQLFERALYAAGRAPRVAIYSPDLQPTVDHRRPTADSPIVFKIHGDVTYPETMVITDEDYIQFVLRMTNKGPYDPIPETFKYFMVDWTTLFVGYSLLDYNLRLLFKTMRWKVDAASIPDMYSIDRHPDPLISSVWEGQRRYVRFIAQDAWLVVPKLYEAVLGRELAP